ncbi:MAG: PilZ domain-containing protein [Myxococcota bacterium]
MPRGPRGIERRKLKRTVTRVPAAFEAGDLRGQGYIKNVSKGGVFLRSKILPDRGSEVRLLFHTREGTKVEVTGIVVWNTGEFGQPGVRPGFGVRFHDRSAEYREFYEQILLY